jgi:hypothetical protein
MPKIAEALDTPSPANGAVRRQHRTDELASAVVELA